MYKKKIFFLYKKKIFFLHRKRIVFLCKKKIIFLAEGSKGAAKVQASPVLHRFAPNRPQVLPVHRAPTGAVTVQVQRDAWSAMMYRCAPCPPVVLAGGAGNAMVSTVASPSYFPYPCPMGVGVPLLVPEHLHLI